MPSNLKSQFLLDPEITFLNFGSFGACPKPVFEEYQRWQRLLEKEPVQFIAVKGPEYLKTSREALAQFLYADANDLVYVTNPTYAVNIVAKNLLLEPGDEVLTTSLEYGACDRTWNYYCTKQQAVYRKQAISLPLTTKEKFLEEFFSGINSKTKVIFISHITSATALILPIQEICDKAREKGILTVIDGAHAPAHISLNLTELGADVYIGACHKWMMAAKGSSFFYVRKEWQHLFDPLVISWGYESLYPSHSSFLDYHQMNGTRDFSAFLSTPAAIQFMQENDWNEVKASCRELVKVYALKFCELLGTAPLCPLSDEFLGQMFSIPVLTAEPEKLQKLLFNRYRIEIPVAMQNQQYYLRYSIQAFNSKEDLEKLHEALSDIIRTTDLIKVQ